MTRCRIFFLSIADPARTAAGTGKRSLYRLESDSAKAAVLDPAWEWTRRIWTGTAGRICSSPMSITKCYSVYQNNHDETFRDVAQTQGVAQATRLLSGWGLKYFDYDNDGAVDLFLANGHPDDMIDNYSMQVKYKEPLAVVSSRRRSQTSRRQRPGRPGVSEILCGAWAGRRRL